MLKTGLIGTLASTLSYGYEKDCRTFSKSRKVRKQRKKNKLARKSRKTNRRNK